MPQTEESWRRWLARHRAAMSEDERAREDAKHAVERTEARDWPLCAVTAVRHEVFVRGTGSVNTWLSIPKITHRTTEALACGHEVSHPARYPNGPDGAGGFQPVARRRCRACAFARALEALRR
jgi:hypothetical protein